MKYINLSTKNLKSVEFFLTYPRLFWNEGLIYKFKQNKIKGNLIDTLTNFLNDRKQRVILNGQHSKWTNIESGYLQGQFWVHYFFDAYKGLTSQHNLKS